MDRHLLIIIITSKYPPHSGACGEFVQINNNMAFFHHISYFKFEVCIPS